MDYTNVPNPGHETPGGFTIRDAFSRAGKHLHHPDLVVIMGGIHDFEEYYEAHQHHLARRIGDQYLKELFEK